MAMVVHDLRNPLNVIGLTLRVIEQMPAAHRSAIQEDLSFLKDNAGQIEKSLGLLSDLCRLGDLGPPAPIELDPIRVVGEILEEKASRATDKAYPATFVSEPGRRRRVVLDPMHARLAILAALTNAAAVTDRPLRRPIRRRRRALDARHRRRSPAPADGPARGDPGGAVRTPDRQHLRAQGARPRHGRLDRRPIRGQGPPGGRPGPAVERRPRLAGQTGLIFAGFRAP